MSFRARIPASAQKTNSLPSDGIASNTRVAKRLSPGARGTTKWSALHGPRLVCVRYREDLRTGKRLTTIELIVEERAPKGNIRLLVKIGYFETGLRQRIKDHGGLWNADHKLWVVPYATVELLGLTDRVIGKAPSVDSSS